MAAPQQGNQDYLDKAFNAGAKKFGGAQGQKIAGNRAMSEKIVRFSPSLPSIVYSILVRRNIYSTRLRIKKIR